MTIYKCNRCGKEVSPKSDLSSLQITKVRWKKSPAKEKWSLFGTSNQVGWFTNTITLGELCPFCVERLVDFMQPLLITKPKPESQENK